MTQRTTFLSGTNWADGEILYAADLNDTINNTFICVTGSLNANMECKASTAFISGMTVTPHKDGLYHVQSMLEVSYSGGASALDIISFRALTGSPGTAIGSTVWQLKGANVLANGDRIVCQYQGVVRVTSGTRIFMDMQESTGGFVYASGTLGHLGWISAFRTGP